MSVIVAQLSGGLGNQLFQYAAARGIAHQSGAQAAIDISLFSNGNGGRAFALATCDLGVPVLDGCAIAADFRSVAIQAQPELARLGCNSGVTLPLHREDNYEFEPATKALRQSVYLVGFWQSPKYFAEIADDLRRRLMPNVGSDEQTAPAGLKDDRAVSIHVRRGDYLAERGLDAFGVCEPGYYAAAIDRVRDRVAGARFFIFSDDPAWCRQNFTDPDMTVVSTPGGEARRDLVRMAHCRHHILGNSSLGWWGAWLGERADATVIAPIPWYNQAPRAADLLADRWLRLNRQSGADWSHEQASIGTERVTALVLSSGRTDLLARAVACVRAQDCGGVEIVVCLREVAPAAVASVKRLLRGQPDCRLAIASAPGAGAALAVGIAQARGNWAAFLDERDVWLPEKLRRQIEAAYLTGAEVVCCRTVPVEGPHGVPAIFPPPGPCEYPLEPALRAGQRICGISHTIARTEIFRKRQLFDRNFNPDADNRVWTRLLLEQRAVTVWGRYVESPVPFFRR